MADIETPETTVIPAASGIFATVITIFPRADGGRPTTDNVGICRMPIVAWRIERGIYGERDVVPLLPNGAGRAANNTVLVELPDGELSGPGVTYFDLDAARAGALGDAQGEWDERHRRAMP